MDSSLNYRPHDVKRYPRGMVVAILSADAADETVAALTAAGVAPENIDLGSGAGDAQRVLDETASGLLGRLTQRFAPGEEFLQRARYVEAMRAGDAVIRVRLAALVDKRGVARLIAERGGHYLNFYGSWTVERLTDL